MAGVGGGGEARGGGSRGGIAMSSIGGLNFPAVWGVAPGNQRIYCKTIKFGGYYIWRFFKYDNLANN